MKAEFHIQLSTVAKTCSKELEFLQPFHPPTSVIGYVFGKHENACFRQLLKLLRIYVFGIEYLTGFVVFVLPVVELQEPDGGNDTDEKQQDRRRKPGKQPTVQQNFVRIPRTSPVNVGQ